MNYPPLTGTCMNYPSDRYLYELSLLPTPSGRYLYNYPNYSDRYQYDLS